MRKIKVGLVQRNPTTACKCWVKLSLTQPILGFFDLLKTRNRKRLQYILRKSPKLFSQKNPLFTHVSTVKTGLLLMLLKV